MRSRVVLLTAVLVAVPLVGGSTAARAAEPCADPTIVGTTGDDTLRGTEGPDVIAGLAGDDRLIGLGGDDVLCGGPGQDVLRGGDGDDQLHGQTDAKVAEDTDYWVYYGDMLDGGLGEDLLDGGSDPRHPGSRDAVTFQDLTHGIRADLRAGTVVTTGDQPETDTIVGPVARLDATPYADVILGSDAPESLYSGPGPDRVVGRGGADWLDAGYRMRGDRDDNVLIGGRGGDTLNGGRGDDLLRGGKGNDGVQANGGADRSYGGAGRDMVADDIPARPGQWLSGGPGRDSMSLTLGDRDGHYRGDLVGRIEMVPGVLTTRVDGYRLRVPLRDFEDVPTPAAKLWTVVGTPQRDVIYSGMDDPVRLFGRGGNDYLLGAVGKPDLLVGGPGYDVGVGWGGGDTFVSIERIRR